MAKAVRITDGPALARHVATLRFAAKDTALEALLPPLATEVCVTLQSMADRSVTTPSWPSIKAMKKMASAVERAYSDIGHVPRRPQLAYACTQQWKRV